MNCHDGVIFRHILNITEVLLKYHFKSDHLVLRVFYFPHAKHCMVTAVPCY